LTRRRILLTAKKTLLNSTLFPLTSFSPSIVGHAFHGTVYSVTQYGAVVEFYSEVRGYLPISELSEAYVSDAREHLRLGQTGKTWVLDVDESEKRLRLSLKDQTYWSQGGETAFKSLEEGSILPATISAKFPDNVVLGLPVDDVVLRGVINVNHLTDSPGSKCEKRLAKLREGTKVQEVLVLNKNLKTRVVTCSMKPALIEAAKEGYLPAKYEDLYRGRRVTGWVKNVEDFGAFVAFAGEAEGVVYKKVSVFLTLTEN
jgi:rRNA biogenesis protein RRP5